MPNQSKSIVTAIGGVLAFLAGAYIVMWFLKPTEQVAPPDDRQLSFEPKELTLDKGQSKVIQLRMAKAPETNTPVFVSGAPELGVDGLVFFNPGETVTELKVEAKEGVKPGTYTLKAGDATCVITVR